MHPSTSTLEITDTHARAGNLMMHQEELWEAVWNLA